MDSHSPNQAAPRLGNGKVLVVDDEPRNLQLVGEILRREGLKFIFATNGADALQAVAEEAPALILLDVMMPGMSGIAVCKKLKESKATKGIPVIFLTAMSEGQDSVEGFAAGAVDYVRKPFIREELLARVHTHIELAATQAHMGDLYQQKSELITTLAHDVKNPMAGVAGLASALKDEIDMGSLDLEELRLVLDLMENSAYGMLELVDGILNEERDFASRGSRVLPMQDVASVADHLVKMNSLQARRKSIRIQFIPLARPMIRVSRRMLTEMFDNLISNAVKYSLAGSLINVRIMESSQYEKGFRFEVADGAPVITDEKREELFQKFKMGTQENVSGTASHGVGLSIVKRLVNLLDGNVGCSVRANGNGNLFFIEIPTVE
ncbi:MAG: hybrid sensor histidine kinase/response regulator [Opitutaceae bacterium]